jgi:hypothetical protein
MPSELERFVRDVKSAFATLDSKDTSHPTTMPSELEQFARDVKSAFATLDSKVTSHPTTMPSELEQFTRDVKSAFAALDSKPTSHPTAMPSGLEQVVRDVDPVQQWKTCSGIAGCGAGRRTLSAPSQYKQSAKGDDKSIETIVYTVDALRTSPDKPAV